MKSGYFSGAGLIHQRAGLQNEDVAIRRINEDFHVVVLCDGGSRCARGRTAALIVSTVVSAYLNQNFHECMWKNPSVLKRELNHLITQKLATAAKQAGDAPKEFGTTLLAAAMDKEGRYCLFHLGDGIAYSDNESTHTTEEISLPQRINGGTSLTMNGCMIDNLRFCRSTKPTHGILYLLTDGGIDMLTKLNCGLKMLTELSPTRENAPEDDYSAGWLFSD